MGDLDERIQRAADAIAATLEATAGELAKTTPRQMSTAPSQERVQVIKLLVKLGEHLPEFCHRAVLSRASAEDWNQVSNTLRAASRAVDHEVTQQHVIIEPEQ